MVLEYHGSSTTTGMVPPSQLLQQLVNTHSAKPALLDSATSCSGRREHLHKHTRTHSQGARNRKLAFVRLPLCRAVGQEALHQGAVGGTATAAVVVTAAGMKVVVAASLAAAATSVAAAVAQVSGLALVAAASEGRESRAGKPPSGPQWSASRGWKQRTSGASGLWPPRRCNPHQTARRWGAWTSAWRRRTNCSARPALWA